MAKYDTLPPQTRKKLQNFVEKSLEDCTKDEDLNYKRLVQEFVFANTSPQNVWNWLEIMGLSVSKLDFNTHHMLISALLSYSWDFPEPVNIKFKELLLRLMSSDALFTTPCLEAALSSIIIRESDEGEASKKFDQETYQKRCGVVLDFLRLAKAQRPDAGTKLFPILLKQWPVHSLALTCFRAYLSNFFRILDLFPELRYRSFQFLLEKVCHEDQCLTELEEFADVDEDERRALFTHHLSIVDLLVTTILQQCSSLSQDTGELTKIWTFVLNCFERTVLKAPQSRHVQFILFYLCQFRQAYATGFLQRLVRISTTPSTPTLVRTASLRYAGGLVGRAKYLRQTDARWCLDTILQWAQNYAMVFQERHGFVGDIPVHEVQKHQSFYTAMQSLVFIIVHRDLDLDDRMDMQDINGEERVQDDESTEKKLARVLNSKLAPLRFIGIKLVNQFFETIESTALRDRLPSQLKQQVNCFGEPEFPFDKFLLNDSKQFFADIYNASK